MSLWFNCGVMTLLNMKYSSEDWLVTAGTTSTTESTTVNFWGSGESSTEKG